MSKTLPDALRDLGDDQGRALPTTGDHVVLQGRKVRTRRRVGGIAVAAVACLAATFVGQSVIGRPTPATLTAASASNDWQAAAAVSSAYDQAEYTYVRTADLIGAKTGKPEVPYFFTESVETWFPRDRSKNAVTRSSQGAPYVFADPADEATAGPILFQDSKTPLTAHAVTGPQPARGILAGQVIDWSEVPRDPEALTTWFRARVAAASPFGGARDDAVIFAVLTDAVLMPEVPADAKSAVLKAIGQLTGVTFEQDARIGEQTGLAAISAKSQDFHQRVRLLLNPQTGRPLAMQQLTYVSDAAETPEPGGYSITLAPADTAPAPVSRQN